MEIINIPIYHPFIDDDHSLWGIYQNTDASGTGRLVRSPDYGATWVDVFDFATLGNGIAKSPIYGMVYISRRGYVFVSLKDNANGQGYLYRSTTPRSLNNSNTNLQFQLVLRYRKGGFTNSWGFTEDNDGTTLYAGTYGHQYTGSVDDLGNEIPIGYIYKSVDDGMTWSENSYFVTNFNARHIHTCQIDPYTNVLYVTIGDSQKKSFRSTDKGVSWTEIADGGWGGETALSFFPSARLWGTDWWLPDRGADPSWLDNGMNGLINLIRKSTGDDTTLQTKWQQTHPPYNNPFYDLHAINDTTAYALTTDEMSTLESCASIWKTRDAGETWELFYSEPLDNELTSPTIIGFAHSRNSLIPRNFPYLIIYTAYRGSQPNGNMHLKRIRINYNSSVLDVYTSTMTGSIVMYSKITLPIYSDPDCTIPDSTIGSCPANQITVKEKYLYNNTDSTIYVQLFDAGDTDGVISYSWDNDAYSDPSAWYTIPPFTKQKFYIKVTNPTTNISNLQIGKKVRTSVDLGI